MNLVDVNEYLANVAQIARKCPTPTLRHAYMRAFREWCQQTQWLRVNIPGSTVALQPQYALGNDPYCDIIGIFAMQGTTLPPTMPPQTWPIGPSNPGTWNPNMNPQAPQTYTYVPEAQFALYPTPDTIYDLVVTAIVTPKEGAVMVPQAPLQKYSNDIEAGALEYLLQLPGMPWTDKVMSVAKGKEFRSGISNGKAEAQRQYNTGAQRATPRPFGGGFRKSGSAWGWGP